MKAKLQIHTDPAFEEAFQKYPESVRDQMNRLRQLVEETARETEGITELEETLKWGEPSFITKKGSTLRMDWKAKNPDQYATYFKCTSRLVPTFKIVFDDLFTYEGDRAIVFGLDDPIPEEELKKCIRATLTYHQVKGDPTLGI